MNQGVQNHFKNPLIRDYGCFFLSLLELARRWSAGNGSPLSVDLESDRTFFQSVERVYSNSVQSGFLLADCTVLSGAGILGALTGAQWTEGARLDFPDWRAQPLAPPAAFKFYVKKLKKTGYTHFILQWYDDVFDPLPPDRPAARFYRFAGYRAYAPAGAARRA
jgi:hypothetical protein